jgi:hypothetical protein
VVAVASCSGWCRWDSNTTAMDDDWWGMMVLSHEPIYALEVFEIIVLP